MFTFEKEIHQRLMKAKILIVAVSLMIIGACTKDKFSTKPSLRFESINKTEFLPGEDVMIKFKLTDKEGDFLDDANNPGFKKPYLFVKRVSFVCPNDVDTSVQNYEIPAFRSRKDLDADLDINFSYNIINGQYPIIGGCYNTKPDSTYFQLWIKDEAGNVSDTVNSATFKLLKD